MLPVVVVAHSTSDPLDFAAQWTFGGDRQAAVAAWFAGQMAAFDIIPLTLVLRGTPVAPLKGYVTLVDQDGETLAAGTLADWRRFAESEDAATKTGQRCLQALRGLAPMLFGIGGRRDARVTPLASTTVASRLPSVIHARLPLAAISALEGLPGVRLTRRVPSALPPLPSDSAVAQTPELAEHADPRVRKAYTQYLAATNRLIAALAQSTTGPASQAVEHALPGNAGFECVAYLPPSAAAERLLATAGVAASAAWPSAALIRAATAE